MAYAPVVQYATPRGDARYDVRGLQQTGPRTWTDGTYTYTGDDPSSALANNRPNPTSGLVGGGGGGGGGSDIFSSPYYQQYQASLQAAQAADLADTKSQIQNLLVQFGLVPGSFQDKYGAVNDTIRNLIKQNTESGISQYARMLEGKQDAQRGTVSGLASRGLLRSGAKGYQLRRNTLNFDRTLSDAMNAVLGNVNQFQSGYANREYQRQQSLAQFLQQLAQSYRPPSPSSSYTPAPPPAPQSPQPQFNAPGFQTQYGVGQTQPSGYQIPTGGGFYTNQQTGDLTAKWKKLA